MAALLPRSERDRGVTRVLAVVLLLNLLVAGAKLAVGLSVGAIALLADAVHSLLDASSNVVGLVGMALASRGPDAGHPYGHRRFETIAATVIGLLIAGGLYEILHRVYDALVGQHDPPNVTPASVGVVLATIVVNLGISWYERRRGKQLRSALLKADAGHTMSDALAAGVVLASFAGAAAGYAWADLLAAGVVCVFIGRVAWRVIVGNLGALADRAQLDPMDIHRVAMGVGGVQGAHRIRSRGTEDHVHVDLHIHLDPAMRLDAAHAKTHEVADALHQEFSQVADVVIHTEPADGREQDETAISPPETPGADADDSA